MSDSRNDRQTGGEDPASSRYSTDGGIVVTRRAIAKPYGDAMEAVLGKLDDRRGVLLTSSFEYPGRYTRWDIGFADPPIEVIGRGRQFEIRALNERGRVLLGPIAGALDVEGALSTTTADDTVITGTVDESDEWFPEEMRSRRPTLFSVLRRVCNLFRSPRDPYLGLYGAFGYELTFQFEAVRERLARPDPGRNLVLFVPDEVLVVDHRRETAIAYTYDFEAGGRTTVGMAREGPRQAYAPATDVERECDHAPGEYAATVRDAIGAFARGDLFEVVPSQTFFAPCQAPPSEVFRRLRERNPAPYGALMNLGETEYLVAASPEMFVRINGRRVETCPISGTVARGANAIEDAARIRELLNSAKEESELTMCTDVDRNDKSRVCVPGSVQVIGRRQIEMYSRLIHTVDHVEGILREGFDGFDAFLAHTWAVTVTGAPKLHAMQFIEDHERSARRWYGGAIGCVGFDGNMNTGLTLRTVRVNQGVAEVRAGATLLFESDPEAEEAETRLKAAALIDAILRPTPAPERVAASAGGDRPGTGKKVLMVDHEDSFVHTLADYFRQTGAEVVTFRSGFPRERLARADPDLVLLSPGPGRPQDFALARTIEAALELRKPLFGVCLGLQGLVEYHGGALDTLPTPMHGKPSDIVVKSGAIFDGLPRRFTAARYHSLFAARDAMPEALEVTAETSDGLVMAVAHRELPLAAVQFHPESILSLEGELGLALVRNVVTHLALD